MLVPSINTQEYKIESDWRLLHHFHSPLIAWVVLVASLSLTVAAFFLSRSYVYQRADERFQFRAREIEQAIIDRLHVYEQILWATVGLMNTSRSISRQDFSTYVSTLKLDKHWPGIQGIGWSIPVKANEKDEHIAAVRRQGFADYTIKPDSQRDYYTAIVYLEPFDWRNKRAFGYDMWSNETRRAAMERARSTAESAMSGIITLMQETDEDIQPGFLSYVPVYQRNSGDALAQPHREFIGWVYAAFRSRDLMRGILGAEDSDIDFELYDGSQRAKHSLLFDSNAYLSLESGKKHDFSRSVTLTIQGRDWFLYFHTPDDYLGEEQNYPLYVLLAGGLVDVLLFYVIFTLYTLNRRAQSIIQERRTMIEQAPNALIMTDAAGAIVLANQQANVLFGYDKNELLGQPIERLIPESFRQKHPEKRRMFLAHPKARSMGAGRDLRGQRKDGSEVPIEIGLNPILAQHEHYVVASIVDITERLQAQHDLESTNRKLSQRNQEMEQFTYTVSHDLRSPLVTIGGFAKQLYDELDAHLNEKQRHKFQRITKNVAFMETLLCDLLELSRVIREKLDIKPVNFTAVINQLKRAMESDIQSSGVTISVNQSTKIVPAQKRLLYQCLQNLLSNAIKYRDTNKPAKIDISLSYSAGYYKIKIKDNGIGIAPEYHKKIFNIFERLDVGEGTGVGLSIVKTIMDKHHGCVELDSELNKGATFTLYFPEQQPLAEDATV